MDLCWSLQSQHSSKNPWSSQDTGQQTSLPLEGLTVPLFGKNLNSHWFQNGQPWGFFGEKKTSLNLTEETNILQQVSLKPMIPLLLLVSNLPTQSATGTFPYAPKDKVHVDFPPAFTHSEATCPDCKAGRPPHDSKGLLVISQPSVAHLRALQLCQCKLRSGSWAYAYIHWEIPDCHRNGSKVFL